MMTSFTPIAMRCNEQQFEAIKPKLLKLGCNIVHINNFDEFMYLVNNYQSTYKHISNHSEIHSNDGVRVMYDKWDEKIFLESIINIGMTPLEYIETTIRQKTAKEFATEQTALVLKMGEGYLNSLYGSEKNNTVALQKKSFYLSKIEQYADMCLKFVGFEENGSLFVLNKKEKFVCFIYDIREHKDGQTSADMYIHYNPLDVDIIEQSVPSKFIFEDFDNWSISKDEQSIIEECNDLISK